jgi:hypothetical protein
VTLCFQDTFESVTKLCVVAAHLSLRARLGVVVVVLLLAQPRPHGVRHRPVAAGGAPEDVLAIRPARVHQRAVALALRRVALCVRSDVVIPRQRADAHVCARHVLRVHVVLWRVLRRREWRGGEDEGHQGQG